MISRFLCVFFVNVLLLVNLAHGNEKFGSSSSLQTDSKKFVNQIGDLNKLHEDLEDLSGYYVSTGNFWLLDLTLNDLNASIQLIYDNRVSHTLDPNFEGFDKVTASIVYGAVIIQDVLAFTRSKKIRSILEKYQEVFFKVNKDVARLKRNKCFPPDLLGRFEILAKTLDKYMEDLYKEKNEIDSELGFLAAYSLGYTAKIASLLSERVIPSFHSGNALPGIGLFIGLVWLCEESYVRSRLETHDKRIAEEKQKIDTYLGQHNKKLSPLLTQVIEMKLRYLKKEEKDSSFRKMMSNCSLTYVLGDLALSLKGLASLLGFKLSVAVATTATVAGIGGVALGSTFIVASSGRYLYNRRHSVEGHIKQLMLNKKIKKVERKLAKNLKKQQHLQDEIDAINRPLEGQGLSKVQQKIFRLNQKLEKQLPGSKKFVRLMEEKSKLLNYAMNEDRKLFAQIQTLEVEALELNKEKNQFQKEHDEIDERFKMQQWTDKFYGLSLNEFLSFSELITSIEGDPKAISELKDFFSDMGFDLSIFNFKPYLGIMRYVSTY